MSLLMPILDFEESHLKSFFMEASDDQDAGLMAGHGGGDAVESGRAVVDPNTRVWFLAMITAKLILLLQEAWECTSAPI